MLLAGGALCVGVLGWARRQGITLKRRRPLATGPSGFLAKALAATAGDGSADQGSAGVGADGGGGGIGGIGGGSVGGGAGTGPGALLVLGIDLGANSLAGRLPASVGDFRGLETLALPGNALGGPLPLTVLEWLSNPAPPPTCHCVYFVLTFYSSP